MPKKKHFLSFLKDSKKQKGSATVILILVIIGIAFLLAGTLSFQNPVQGPIVGDVVVTCCDSGDGDACKPLTGEDQVVTYNGEQYGLLRSNMVLAEGNLHLKDTGETFNGQPIILNSSDTHEIPAQYATATCRTEPKDKYLKSFPPAGVPIGSPQVIPLCVSIPDDQIIFVCKDGCYPSTCPYGYSPEVTCYGGNDSQYDAYFRLVDAETPGVPDFIKNCDKTSQSSQAIVGANPTVVADQYETQDDLQLGTFKIVGGSNISPWISPWCKPAIYLYPEKTQETSVQVDPVGKMTVSIPSYEKGWNVTAEPNGNLTQNTKPYPYLYYEADIPDVAIVKPDEGYLALEKQGLQTRLTTLLPSLGLNAVESKDFIGYWIKTLPISPYYVIRVISENTLDAIAPLSINPAPDSVIRVTLYFELSDTPVILKEPTISTPKRQGFTVVEWGGLVKHNPNQPFTCFQ